MQKVKPALGIQCDKDNFSIDNGGGNNDNNSNNNNDTRKHINANRQNKMVT